MTDVAIMDFVRKVADNTLPFVTAMAAVGALSMALIQTLKDMFPIRNVFQRLALERWLRKKAGAAVALKSGKADPARAEEDLVRLATAGDRKALYDLPIEQMCGQMNAAAQVILDYPHEHQDLLRCLASLAERSDIERLIEAPVQGAAGTQRTQEQVDARTRLIHQLQRAIDGFQISAGFRWKLYLQIASFLVSFALVVIGLYLYYESLPGFKLINVSAIVVTGIAGGFLAPVARDLVVSLQKLRG